MNAIMWILSAIASLATIVTLTSFNAVTGWIAIGAMLLLIAIMYREIMKNPRPNRKNS
jgi:hypothetical protein